MQTAKASRKQSSLSGKELILIIAMDSDDKDPQTLRQEIYAVASQYVGVRNGEEA